MSRADIAYALGVLTASAGGFCSPLWFLGFLPLSAGLLWASYDLIDAEGVPRGNTPTAP